MLDISDTIWVIKIPTKKSDLLILPIEIERYEYSLFFDTESMYDGSYPEAFEIVCYSIPSGGEIVVPYNNGHADDRYGFYEFNTKNDIRTWCNHNMELAEALFHDLPEYFA